MWVKVDDGFPEHPKVIRAAEHLDDELGRVIAVWLEAMCYCARHLTDGRIPVLVARKFICDRKPIEVLEVMCLDDVRLLKKVDGGYLVHDYLDYQPSAADQKEKRERDRNRKRGADSGSSRNGNHAESRPLLLGIGAESSWNPERSRARDPVPVHDPRTDQEPRGLRRARPARMAIGDVRRHLRAAVHALIESGGPYVDAQGHPNAHELLEELKTIAARSLQADWEFSRELAVIVDAVIGERQTRAQGRRLALPPATRRLLLRAGVGS